MELPDRPHPRRIDRVPPITEYPADRQSIVPTLPADQGPLQALASGLPLLKPLDHHLAVQVHGSPPRNVGHVYPAGCESPSGSCYRYAPSLLEFAFREEASGVHGTKRETECLRRAKRVAPDARKSWQPSRRGGTLGGRGRTKPKLTRPRLRGSVQQQFIAHRAATRR